MRRDEVPPGASASAVEGVMLVAELHHLLERPSCSARTTAPGWRSTPGKVKSFVDGIARRLPLDVAHWRLTCRRFEWHERGGRAPPRSAVRTDPYLKS